MLSLADKGSDPKGLRMKKIEAELEFNKVLAKVVFFPGTLEEFRDLGNDVIDTDVRDKGLLFEFSLVGYLPSFDFDLKKRLVDSGIVAIVHCGYSNCDCNARYGLPVGRRKR